MHPKKNQLLREKIIFEKKTLKISSSRVWGHAIINFIVKPNEHSILLIKLRCLHEYYCNTNTLRDFGLLNIEKKHLYVLP